jgi:hypothetical protein
MQRGQGEKLRVVERIVPQTGTITAMIPFLFSESIVRHFERIVRKKTASGRAVRG